MLSLFLGAGFSKWAANLPLVSELFDFDITTHNRRDDNRLQSIIKFKSEWDRQNPSIENPEIFIRDVLLSSKHKSSLVKWYITRRLSDQFIASILGGTQTLMIDDKRAQRQEGVIKAKKFLDMFTYSNGILSTNYDMLVEYSFGTSGFNYGIKNEKLQGRNRNPVFPWQGGPVYLKGEIKYSKLHGSISWDDQYKYTDGRCGVKGNALIVPLIPEKITPQTLLDIWGLGKEILMSSDYLTVFGFAFNDYDQAVLNFLKNSGVNLKNVLLIDISAGVENKARELWPHAKIDFSVPPPDDNGFILEWIHNKQKVRSI